MESFVFFFSLSSGGGEEEVRLDIWMGRGRVDQIISDVGLCFFSAFGWIRDPGDWSGHLNSIKVIGISQGILFDKVISKITTNLELERTRGIRLFN